jgi:hypothetical protein
MHAHSHAHHTGLELATCREIVEIEDGGAVDLRIAPVARRPVRP